LQGICRKYRPKKQTKEQYLRKEQSQKSKVKVEEIKPGSFVIFIKITIGRDNFLCGI
jgi:hypothetical protein